MAAAFPTQSRDVSDRYDIVIVGGGTAGCVLANRLSANPRKRVLLIEAGQDIVSGEEPADILDLFPRSHANPAYRWRGLTGHALTRADSPLSAVQQAQILGGGSSIMGMIALRGTPADYDGWQAVGADGWGWDHVLPYFTHLETDEDFPTALHGRSGPTHIRRHPRSSWPPLNRAGAAYSDRLGIEFIADMNANFGNGHGATPIFARADRRSSAVSDYLGTPIRARRNLTIWTGGSVTGLTFADDRVTGVTLHRTGNDIGVAADEVILAAGAIFSPQILMRAGIGPAAMLAGAGICVRRDLPGVGQNLQNHAMLTIVAPLRERARQRRPLANHNNSFFRFSSAAASEGDADLGLSYGTRAAWHSVSSHIASFGLLLLSPRSRGRITLDTQQNEAVIEYNLLGEHSDLARLTEGLRFAAALIESPEMRPLVGSAIALTPRNRSALLAGVTPRNRAIATALSVAARCIPGFTGLMTARLDPEALKVRSTVDEAELQAYIRKSVIPVGHHAGSCRMGRANDPLAVVDAAGRVHGVKGLRVVDASIMPTVPRANTNLPTLMLAEKIAASINGGIHAHR